MEVNSNFERIGITDDEWYVDGDYGGGGGGGDDDDDDDDDTEWWHQKEFDMLNIKWVFHLNQHDKFFL